MGLLNKKKVENSSNKAYRALYSSTLYNNTPIPIMVSLTAEMSAGYTDNPTLYAIINKIANAVATAPLKVKTMDGEEVEPTEAQALLYPNEDTTRVELIKSLLIYYLTVGNSYLYSPILTTDRRRETWLLPADYTEAISGGWSKPVKSYHLLMGSQDVTFRKEDVLHFKMFNPRFVNGSYVYGLSPVAVAADIIRALETNEERALQMMERGTPPFILSAQLAEGLTELQQEQLEKTYEQKYEGTDNANKPLLSGIPLRADKIGFSSADLELIQHSEHSLRVLCSVYGVPSVLFNDNANSTYNNVETAEVDFYENTVKPLATYLEDKMSAFYLSEGYRFEFDFSTVAVLAKAKAELLNSYNTVSFLTDNEKRAIFGYEPVETTNIGGNSDEEANV